MRSLTGETQRFRRDRDCSPRLTDGFVSVDSRLEPARLLHAARAGEVGIIDICAGEIGSCYVSTRKFQST